MVFGPEVCSVAAGESVGVPASVSVPVGDSVAVAVADPVSVVAGVAVVVPAAVLVPVAVVASGTGVVGRSPGSVCVSVGVTVTVCVAVVAGAAGSPPPQADRKGIRQSPTKMGDRFLCMGCSDGCLARGASGFCGAAEQLRFRDETTSGQWNPLITTSGARYILVPGASQVSPAIPGRGRKSPVGNQSTPQH